MTNKSNLLAEKEKVFENAVMKIVGNVIACENNFIQVSNITQVWKGDIPKPKLPWIPLAMGVLAGLGALQMGISSYDGTVAIIIGLIILGIVGFVVYRHMSLANTYGLNIELTSGRTYSFTSKNSDFIAKAFSVLNNVIEDSTMNNNYLINFGSGNIINETGDVVLNQN